MPSPLSESDAKVLDLAGRTYAFEGAREADVWDELHVTMHRFWQRANLLIDTEAALARDPLNVKRLRRLRDARLRRRAS
jgi:hypothetical protein